MPSKTLVRLRDREAKLITVGGEWFELVADGMTRSTLQRDLRIIERLGVKIFSTNPDGGTPGEHTLFYADKRTAFFNHCQQKS